MLSEPVPMDASAERIPRRIDAMGGGGGGSSNDNNDIRCLEARQKGVVRIDECTGLWLAAASRICAA